MEGGKYEYLRDGKKYPGGAFGGDIVGAVHGNPQAEEYAREYKSGVTSGNCLTLAGILTGVAGLTIAGVDIAENPNRQSISDTTTVGLITAGAGLVVELIGIIIASNARPHLFDAINAFNDGLDSPGNREDRNTEDPR
jgi:hypothetical protein